jgi:4-amino-4-deoxy-L-arabinose transferase-like glycosyltransferase
VTETNAVITENSPSTTARVGGTILILATLYVCYFSHLGAIGFVGPDEPRYAWIARDMVETGDWVTPRLYGKPWFEKPPLFYWGGALSFKLFGVSEAAARVPSALSALLATLALAWLALRLYGAETACWLLLLLPTTVGMIGFSHAAATDMPFSGMLTIAMVCAVVVLGLTRNENSSVIPQTPWFALILFGFFLGLAVLAKGPAAIILSGGAIFFWALFTKRWRDALRLFHPAALASFCLTALPWYILCARRNPDFFRTFIVEHNFKRYLTPEFQHLQPFWYYIPVLLVAFLPWTALLVWSAVEGALQLWRTRCTKESTWFLICWAGFCILFFSISQSKLPGYVLPAFPAIALLIAHTISIVPSAHRTSLAVTLGAMALCLAILVVLLALSVIHLGSRYEAFSPLLAPILGALAVCIFLLGSSFLPNLRTPSRDLLIASSFAVLLFLVGRSSLFLGRANIGSLSARWLAFEILRDDIPLDQLRVLRIKRGDHYALNFYLHKEVRDWETDPLVDGYVLSNGLYCEQLKTRGRCVDLWGSRDFASGSWALLRITSENSPPSLPRREQPH